MRIAVRPHRRERLCFDPVTDAGRYVYVRNGESVSVDEHWDREHATPDDVFVRSWRATPSGTSIGVEARCNKGLAMTAVIEWESNGPIKRRTVRYAVLRQTLVWSLDGANHVMAVPVGALLSPLLRVFQGPVIAAVADIGSQAVIVPFLHDPTDAERLLTPTVELRTAQIVEAGDDGVDMYTYESSVYDRDARFWIDRSTRHLLRYRFRQGSDQWEIAAAD